MKSGEMKILHKEFKENLDTARSVVVRSSSFHRCPFLVIPANCSLAGEIQLWQAVIVVEYARIYACRELEKEGIGERRVEDIVSI